MTAKIGYPAPELKVSKWIQGPEINIEKEKGSVIFIEAFQMSCLNSFLHGIPKTIDIYNKYHKEGLIVIGLATAFGHYEKNTLHNLELLLTKGELQKGPLHNILIKQGVLIDGDKYPYKLNFSVAMDSVIKLEGKIEDEKIDAIALARIPNFSHYHLGHKAVIFEQIKQGQLNKNYFAETLHEYLLEGTPASILIDKKGILRHVIFGYDDLLEKKIQALLAE